MSLMSQKNFGQTAAPIDSKLKIIFIRHGEKPEKGSNLTCKGLNRSLHLPTVIQSKFGIPDHIFVPTLKMGDKTAHARMFETAIPIAVRFNLPINSLFDEKDTIGMAARLITETGVVLVIWEHSAIAGILHQLGISEPLIWPKDDYDSIWIITFKNGKGILNKDIEGIIPSEECP